MPKYFPIQGEIWGHTVLTKRAVVENLSIHGTSLNNCHVHPPADPADRTVLRHIEVSRIQHYANHAWGTFFDDVSVTDIRGGARFLTWLAGCAFRHVTLCGWIGGVAWRGELHCRDDKRMEERYQKANQKHYQATDWAVDITEAQFSTSTWLWGIPPHLVRRNPATQFVLTRASAETFLYERPDPVWSYVAKRLIESAMTGVVIPVGGSGDRPRRDLAEAHALRDVGLLE